MGGYFDALERAGDLQARRRARLERELRSAVTRKIGETLDRHLDLTGRIEAAVDLVLSGSRGPCALAAELARNLLKEAGG
jgi:hypothetical protein